MFTGRRARWGRGPIPGMVICAFGYVFHVAVAVCGHAAQKGESRESIHGLPSGVDQRPHPRSAPPALHRELDRDRRRRASAFRPGSAPRHSRRLRSLGESRARAALAAWRLDRVRGQPRRRNRGAAGAAPERGFDARVSVGRVPRLLAGRALAGVDRRGVTGGTRRARGGGGTRPGRGGSHGAGDRRDARLRVGVTVALRPVGTIPGAARRSARGTGGEGGRPADRGVGHGVRDQLRQRCGDGLELLRIADRNGDRDRNRPGQRRAGLRCRLGHAAIRGRVRGPLPGAGVARRCGRSGGPALARGCVGRGRRLRRAGVARPRPGTGHGRAGRGRRRYRRHPGGRGPYAPMVRGRSHDLHRAPAPGSRCRG